MTVPPPRPEVTALDHFVLRVADLNRALAFYHGLLGLPVRFLDDFRAGRRPFVSLAVGAQLIDLVPDPTYDGAAGGFLHLCLRIRGTLEPLLEELRQRGVEVLEATPVERMGATGIARSIYVRDPEGYVVELKEDAGGD